MVTRSPEDKQHIKFPVIRLRGNFMGKPQQSIRLPAHGGQHHHDLVACSIGLFYQFGNPVDSLNIPNRRPAEFLD